MASIDPGVQITVKGAKGELLTFGDTTAEGFFKVGAALLGEDVFKVVMGGVEDHLLGNAAKFDEAQAAVQSGLQGGAAPGLSGQAPQQAAPAQSAGLSCPHGQRTRRNGTNSRGAWVGHFCPLPKGDSNQCKPIFE